MISFEDDTMQPHAATVPQSKATGDEVSANKADEGKPATTAA